jgi:endonuclease/exonuclease/phosphatase family metal-dependent hydrolase
MQRKKNWLKTLLLIIYIGIVFIYLLTCLVPFLDPATFWFIAILGMGFPVLLIILLVCLVVCALLRSRWSFLASAALLISWQQISVAFAFRTSKEFDFTKQENNLRVLTWNVSSWTEDLHIDDKVEKTGLRNLMMDAVQMQNADVLCFQEYFDSFAPELFPANIPVLQKMGFNYYHFTPIMKIVNEKLQGGLCIFSKYPFVDTSFSKFQSTRNSEGISIADIQFSGKIIRIINTHLESPRLAKQEYNPLGEIEESRSVAGKIKRAYSLRSSQAEALRNCIDTSSYPVIVCGDFNDVPNSYSYFKIKGGLQDAFLKKGSGVGKTFQFISPTLRIDFMLADKRFKVDQFAKPDYRYSDHYPQVMDVSLKQ